MSEGLDRGRRASVRAGLVLLAVLLPALAGLACGKGAAAGEGGRRVIVLGIDGMDWDLTRRMIDAGELPNLRRLAEGGTSQPLATSVPPLSPVAWSDFITGLDSGGHGIFDFIHREPASMTPYLSTSRATEPDRYLRLGDLRIPLGGGHELLRRGRPFWAVLDERGIETTVIRIPANFPPSGSARRELSGMGTPDVRGTYGTFTFFTSDIFTESRDLAGGEVRPLDFWNGIAEGTLEGPPNPMLADQPRLEADFQIFVDAESGAAKVAVGGHERLLRPGEWSDWVPVELETMPIGALRRLGEWLGADLFGTRIHGMVRFFLRRLEPEIEIYASPINFDPLYGDLPISTPASYAAELAEATGRFYTQGMPEDTQALKGKVLEPEEFLAQARIAGEEIEKQYRYVLDRFERGLLFYYFGNLDQVSHLLWHVIDPEHPAYDAERDGRFREAIYDLYRRADEIVGHTLERLPPDATLIVMSDHGFTSWRRTFHLNNWLREQGYLALADPGRTRASLFAGVDWSRTRAYGLGLNGLYLNLQGREVQGLVPPPEREALLRELSEKLLAAVDPATGEPAIAKVFSRDDFFKSRGALEIGPDLVLGYAKGTRGSSESALGDLSTAVFSANTDDWSGDHGMDPATVPGILFTNRPLSRPVASLKDLAGAILAEFGIEGFPASG